MMRRMRETGMRDEKGHAQAWLLAGLAIFIGLLVSGRANDLLPSTERLVLVFASLVVLAIVAVPRVRPYAPLILVFFFIAGGLLLRWVSVTHPGGSDVLPVTNEALSVVLGGGNPYDHFYVTSKPAGAPFPYPPINLLVHLPGYLIAGLTGVRWTELAAAFVVLILLGRKAIRDGHPLAILMLAVYAALPNLVNLVGDGSNDTSAGTMVVLFMLALLETDREDRRRAILAGVLAAAAIGTKQSALPLVVAGSAWLLHANRLQLRRYLLALLATLLVVSAPFLVLSGPVNYVKALTAFAGFHTDVYGWNIWVFAKQMGWPVASREDALVVGAVIALATLVIVAILRYRSLQTAFTAGAIAMAVLFLTQRWTAYSYFAQLIPVVLMLPLLRPWDWSGADAGGGEPGGTGPARDGAEPAQAGAEPGAGPEPEPGVGGAAASMTAAIRATALCATAHEWSGSRGSRIRAWFEP